MLSQIHNSRLATLPIGSKRLVSTLRVTAHYDHCAGVMATIPTIHGQHMVRSSMYELDVKRTLTSYPHHLGDSDSTWFSSLELTQVKVRIPSGSTVDCSGFGRVTRAMDMYASEFRILVDHVPCASLVATTAEEWQRLTSTPITVVGDEHMVTVDMSTAGFGSEDEVVVDLDDLAVTYASGSGEVGSCVGTGR